MKKYLLIIGLCIAAFCFTGCGHPRLSLNVASQPNVNPDNSGRPSPLLVKVYELRNDLAFKQADFQSLFEHPVPTLGADLIAADDLVFIPGEARKVAYRPSTDTRFLGIVASFRQMDRAQWRVIKAIDPEDDSLIALEFNDTAMLVIPDKKARDWEPEEAVKEFQQQLNRPAPQPQPSKTSPTGGPENVQKGAPADASAKQPAQGGNTATTPAGAGTPSMRVMQPY